MLGDVLPSVSTRNVVQVPIRIEVVWGGIAQADADAIAVGHYVDVYPTAAELVIDKAISGDVEDRRRVLHAAMARGVLKGASATCSRCHGSAAVEAGRRCSFWGSAVRERSSCRNTRS